jgi:hypothetical protein
LQLKGKLTTSTLTPTTEDFGSELAGGSQPTTMRVVGDTRRTHPTNVAVVFDDKTSPKSATSNLIHLA